MSCGMGFMENHSVQAKSKNVVSSSCREKSEEPVLEMEKPKYKRRRVLGVRTFPPGCGPNAEPIPGNLADSVIESHGLAVSGGENGDSVPVENGSNGLRQDLELVALENGHDLAVPGGENGDSVPVENQSNSLRQGMDSVALENGGSVHGDDSPGHAGSVNLSQKDVLEQTDHVESKVDSKPDGDGVPNDVTLENANNVGGDETLEQMDHFKSKANDEMGLPDNANEVASEAEGQVNISPSEKLETDNNPGVNAPEKVSQHEIGGLTKESLTDAELTVPAKEAVVQKYPPRRKITGVRDFPPNCGRNAKPPSKVEGLDETEKANDIDMEAAEAQQGRFEGDRDFPPNCERNVNPPSKVEEQEDTEKAKGIDKDAAGAQHGTSGSDVLERNGGNKALKPKPKVSTGNESRNLADILKGKAPIRKSSFVKRKVARKSVIMPQDSRNKFSLGKKLSQTDQIDENCDDSQVVRRPVDRNAGSTSSGPGSSRGSDAQRNKVQEVLRLFHSLCKIYEEEAKSNPGKRVDILAANELKVRGLKLNVGQNIIGAVPGVEVGDEFQYRLELHIIGLHRPTQGGIDYAKQPRGIIATSIVASGGYDDNLDDSDVLEYTGQGGVSTKDKQAEDQKLERGNLSLKNSVTVKNPVRVVRGRNRMTDDGKVCKVYIYDGLYTVEKYWQETGPQGKLVFKFWLVRMSGQPELAWKQSKNSKKVPTGVGRALDSRELEFIVKNEDSRGGWPSSPNQCDEVVRCRMVTPQQ
ncbi:Histone-lysine N-methyltransferase, H3 lysine-9 specific SUVH5 [Linum perenne]